MTSNHEDKLSSLRDRIRRFVLDTIKFARTIPKDEVGKVFINQLLRSTTSIGANFEESSEAESNSDIVHKMSIVKKEAKEAKYWLELVAECYPEFKSVVQPLINEADELIRIFFSIILKKKSN